MIASRIEIKSFLSITSTSQDNLIDMLIPVIESDVREYCNNGFRDDKVYVISATINFTHNSTSADVIGIDDGFVDSGFLSGQTVQVQGSYNNDGFYDIESVSSTSLTLYSSTSRPYFDELVDEDEDLNVCITKVNYPKALKLVVADMINFKLEKKDYSIQSETVARYSVTFNSKGTDVSNGYPKALMSGLNRWKNVRFS